MSSKLKYSRKKIYASFLALILCLTIITSVYTVTVVAQEIEYTVGTYESDYTTPDTTFCRGDRVYGKGTRTGSDYPAIRLRIRDPSNNVVKQSIEKIGTEVKTYYDIPLDAPTGTWTIQIGTRLYGNTYSWSENVSAGRMAYFEVEKCGTNIAPVAICDGPYFANISEMITFDGSASYDVDSNIASYEWDFGDGNTSSGAIVTHTYMQPGIYDVTLTVTDDDPPAFAKTDVAISNSTIIVPNPVLLQSCGVDMVLIIDTSGSINSLELQQMKNALNLFVDEFLPDTPTNIAVVEFDEWAHTVHPYSSDPTVVHAAINGATNNEEHTNWHDALVKAYDLYDYSIKPDLYIFASDGNPNYYGPEEALVAASTVEEALAPAVDVANTLKLEGIKIITLGIGNNLDAENLIAISGPDDFYASNFEDLADTLAGLADELCGGAVIVQKMINGTPVAGWNFTLDVEHGYASPSYALTDAAGIAVFDVIIDEPYTETLVDIHEEVPFGYQMDNATGEDCAGNPVGTEGLNSLNDIMVTEDCRIYGYFNNSEIPEVFDFADNPDSPYLTLLENNGPRHLIPLEGATLYLGFEVDTENDGLPDADALGDDNDGIDDEDGITFTSPLVKCASTDIDVVSSAAGYLDAWIDFNADGDFDDAGEKIFTSEALVAGTNSLSFNVPCSSYVGDTYSLFRLSSNDSGIPYYGRQEDGEVESYKIEILCEEIPPVIEKIVGSPSTPGTEPGDPDYFVTTATGITAIVTDDLPVTTYIKMWAEGDPEPTSWTEWSNPDTTPITFPGECTYYLSIRAVDDCDNEAIDNEVFCVDDNKPEIQKTVGSPNCLIDEQTGTYCVKTTTPITIDVNEECCNENTVEYRVWTDTSDTGWIDISDQLPFDYYFTDECEHHLEIRATDKLGRVDTDNELFYVDNKAPTLTKIVGDDNCDLGDGDYCVTPDTLITLEAVDQGCCPCCLDATDVTIEYRIWYDDQWSGPFEYTEPFSFEQECMHMLEVTVSDCLGNSMTDTETFYVDDSTPIIVKEVGEPKCTTDLPSGIDYIVTTSTPIDINIDETSCCPSTIVEISSDGTNWQEITVPYTHYFTELCSQDLYIRATDCLGHQDIDYEAFIVDDEEITIEKTVGEPKCINPEQGVDFCVTTSTPIDIDIAETTCYKDVTVEISENGVDWTEITVPYTHYFTDECFHELFIKAYDCLGNMDEDYETFYVDDTTPEIIQTVGEPNCIEPTGADYAVTTDTPIEIDILDDSCCPSLTVEISENGVDWTEITVPYTHYFAEQCNHELFIKAYDCLGHIDEMHTTFLVDDEDFDITVTYGEPKCQRPSEGEPGYCECDEIFCITELTPITIDVNDPGCLQDVTVQISWDGNNWETLPYVPYEMYVTEQCHHVLLIKAFDCLGNSAMTCEEFYVDDTPPEMVTKIITGPKVELEKDIHGHDQWMIFPETEISFEYEDQTCCPLFTIYYRIWYLGEWTDWMPYNEAFTLTEGCVHYVEAKIIDCFGREGPVDNETFWVCSPGGDGGLDISFVEPVFGSEHCERTLEVIVDADNFGFAPEDLTVKVFTIEGRIYHWYETTYADGYYYAYIDIYKYKDTLPLTLEAVVYENDNPGSTTRASPVTFTVCSDTLYDQWMEEGWNQLTIPFGGNSCGNLVTQSLASLDEKYSKVYYYNVTDEKWYGWFEDIAEGYSDLHKIHTGKTYWVKMKEPSRYYTDTTKPTISIDYPLDGSMITELTSDISGSAEDMQSGLSKVRLRILDINTGEYWSGIDWISSPVYYLLCDGTENWAYTATSSIDWTGRYGHDIELSANVLDKAGCSDTDTIFFVLTDTMPPSIDITYPLYAETYDDCISPDEITGTAVDLESGIDYVEITIYDMDNDLYWTGADWGAETALSCSYDSLTDQWSYSSIPTWTHQVTYEITATAYDNFGIIDTDTEMFYYECVV